ncbi:MAG: YigZ family protein, partial [Parasporobacterium sp.]|nr:YigZ family protein [Parasporobacterium sp.]
MSSYVVLGQASSKIEVKKSVFIATVREVHTEAEALAFLEEMRKQYWDAKHNCYAYVLGENDEIR